MSACQLLLATAPPQASAASSLDLADLSLEQLMDVRITSVSRREQSLSGAAASVFVITRDDIRRSGATSLPEVLRMAPNLQVARINAYEYAITARGFNNAIGNKLLVLVDGRTAYTPLFSGVFWEMQETVLRDIERVEVISGPGATLWGANAVNGVINIITRDSADTQGTLLSAFSGNNEYGAALRHGGELGGGGSFRVWGRARDHDHTYRADGTPAIDAWRSEQIGFRADWEWDGNEFTLLGDALHGRTPHRGFSAGQEIPPVNVRSNNLLARWTRQLDDGSDIRVQAYWSHSHRDEFVLFSPDSDILDLEWQHHLDLDDHQVVWGGGYRHADDSVAPGAFTTYIPAERRLEWESLFIQDEIRVGERLRVTPGLRLEWNDYTGLETLPSLRASWQFSPGHLGWAALSRAVRAPSRFDRDVYFPEGPPFIIAGGPDFESEVAVVAELGLRGEAGAALNYSVTLYHHDWSDLRSGTSPPFPVFLDNNIRGEAYGVEAWANWQVNPRWRLRAGVTTLEKNLSFRSGTSDTVGVDNPSLHNDPSHQWMLRSSMELGADFSLDLQLRRVAALEVEPVPAYSALDLWLAWTPLVNLQIYVSGKNLLDRRHPEFGELAIRSEFSRSVILGLEWRL